jgi:beta-lactamase class A
MIDKRRLLVLFGGALAAGGAAAAEPPALGGAALRKAVAAIEARSGGRLGVAVLDTADGRRFGWKADERFPMCSTFKMLLAAATLKRVDGGRERLQRLVPVGENDPVGNSPFTASMVGKTATVAQLCQAAITVSDNGAANLLLAAVGGPARVTAFARSLGDPVTRLDRTEPALNTAIPGDPRDTTSPRAILDDLRLLLLGAALAPGSRAQLQAWLVANTTGGARLRAGLPKGWKVGDKTGSSGGGTINDLAIAWPRGRAPLLIASYATQCPSAAAAAAVHPKVAAAVVTALRRPS